MIGKVMIGKSFRGCLLYCLNDKKQEVNKEQKMQNRAEILLFHKCGGRDKELVQQFNEVRALNNKLAKPVLHITLSLAEGDKASRQTLIEISESCAREMGFQNNQWVAVLHHDTNHPHLHMVANRIGFDGSTVSDSNSYKRIALFCRKMEEKHGLQQVLSSRAFLSQKEKELPRLDNRKLQLQKQVKQCLFLAKNFEQFEGLMKEKKITIERSRGIAFTDEKKMRVKGSELGYSLLTIERILAKKQGLSMQPTCQTKQVNDKVEKQSNHSTNQLIKTQQVGLIPSAGKAVTSLLTQLMKPEHEAIEPIAQELLQEAKKKKKKLRHY